MTSTSTPDFPLRHWSRRGAGALFLWPVSQIYRALSGFRRFLYARRLLRTGRLDVPVVVVGNLTVGGTGKTPLVIALARALLVAGYRPGIVSRGYPGSDPGPREVHPGDSPSEVGDESLLLAARCECPVFIGRKRFAAGGALLAQHPEVDVILCDDGLQHYALARDIEIAVEDSRGSGNGFLLPAGPLREPVSRRVDYRVANGVTRTGTSRMDIVPAGFFWVDSPRDPVGDGLLTGSVHAFAGIGSPDRFFRSLQSLGLSFVEHRFPDHHAYRAEDLQFEGADWILMTEKDAVKCRRFGRDNLVYLRVDARLDPAFLQRLTSQLRECLNGRQTS